MTVKQLLSSLDSPELAEWKAFFKIRNEKGKQEDKMETEIRSLRGYKR
jgi:hypothetical protein